MTSSILPLQLDEVSVKRRGIHILQKISFTLAPAGFTIVMGPNGSGKTTLLRLMHGLEHARGGTVQWNCSEHQARQKQSFVFQNPVMLRRSVIDNIAYPLKAHGLNKAAVVSQSKKWAKTVGLDHIEDVDAINISGGEQQKLAIARALIREPDLIFLDEPTTNLDGTSTREIENILKEAFNGGTRIVMTTHDIGQAKRLATEVIFLSKGKLCEFSPAKQFFNATESPTARAYLDGEIVD